MGQFGSSENRHLERGRQPGEENGNSPARQPAGKQRSTPAAPPPSPHGSRTQTERERPENADVEAPTKG